MKKYFMQHIAYCLLPVACCLLLIANCLLPIAYCQLPVAYIPKDTLQDSFADEDTISVESYTFQSIEYMTEENIIALIDSLLDEETIPRELIHEITLYVESQYDENTGSTSTESYEPSVIPAHNFYLNWDTYNTHPYPNTLSKDDSIVLLVLQDNDRQYVSPLAGDITVTSKFGDNRNHNGIDIDLKVWDTVVSAFDGMVRIARKHGGYGRVVVVRHYNGLETFYAHLHRIKVKPNESVKAGQLIGLGGSSGHSTGSHLHFECRFKGKPLNPVHFINIKYKKLFSDTVLLSKTQWSYEVHPKGIKYYIVEKGDYLYKIAERYGTTVGRLCELNGISNNSILRVGRKLRIGK